MDKAINKMTFGQKAVGVKRAWIPTASRHRILQAYANVLDLLKEEMEREDPQSLDDDEDMIVIMSLCNAMEKTIEASAWAMKYMDNK